MGCGRRQTLVRLKHIAVHILNGEYDYTGSIEAGQEAHAAIPGSTWMAMDGVGHFGMSVNPEKFLEYILPLLRRVREAGGVSAVRVTA